MPGTCSAERQASNSTPVTQPPVACTTLSASASPLPTSASASAASPAVKLRSASPIAAIAPGRRTQRRQRAGDVAAADQQRAQGAVARAAAASRSAPTAPRASPSRSRSSRTSRSAALPSASASSPAASTCPRPAASALADDAADVRRDARQRRLEVGQQAALRGVGGVDRQPCDRALDQLGGGRDRRRLAGARGRRARRPPGASLDQLREPALDARARDPRLRQRRHLELPLDDQRCCRTESRPSARSDRGRQLFLLLNRATPVKGSALAGSLQVALGDAHNHRRTRRTPGAQLSARTTIAAMEPAHDDHAGVRAHGRRAARRGRLPHAQRRDLDHLGRGPRAGRRTLAGRLAQLGLQRGDTVALMLANRPEFHLCDLAVLMTGATPFSVYQTSPPNQIRYIVGDAGARVMITEQSFLPRILEARKDLPDLETVIVIDGEAPRRRAAPRRPARDRPRLRPRRRRGRRRSPRTC